MGEVVVNKIYRRSLSEGDSTDISGQMKEEMKRKFFFSENNLGDNYFSPLLRNEDEEFKIKFSTQISAKGQRPVKSHFVASSDIAMSDAPVLSREELKEKGGLPDDCVEHVEGKHEVLFDNGEQVNCMLGDSGYDSLETNKLPELESSLPIVKEVGIKEQDIDMKEENTQIISEQRMQRSQRKATKRLIRIYGRMIRIYGRMKQRKKCKRKRKWRMKKKRGFQKLEHLVCQTMISPKNRKTLDQIQMAVKMIGEECQKSVVKDICNLQKIAWKGLENKALDANFNRLTEVVIFPIWELPDLDYRREWDRLCSFGSRLQPVNLLKVSYIRLAKCGFFYEPKEGEEPLVKCFACFISLPVDKLESEPNCNEKLQSVLHLEGCNLNGNKPINLACSENTRKNTLPSKNKKPFTSEFGLEVKCKDFCALNTFYVDQDTMLQTFPRLKEKYMLYSQSTDLENPFMLILQMLDESDSTRGMVRLLQHLELIPADEKRIVLSDFKLNNFICELMKRKIVLERKCSCRTTNNFKEQIVIYDFEDSSQPLNGISHFQHCINETCRMMTQSCEMCKEQIEYTLRGPPPCLFVSLTFLQIEHSADIPEVVFFFGRRYRKWAVYLHGDNHFTCEIQNSNGGQSLYNDVNVMEGNIYSGCLVSLEHCMSRPGKPCMVSFCATD
ncbi:uncharacterized protein LOC125683304 isoform X2 [Ostrea edulis]|uniref:uncharacterized protein LOC125683304 isoform X2 n=1 Tax=Ostrea edulis TaxID=37623 RepID=UPI0024AFA850|nr:uncharacterized protein LOC125683304 isoform X2 [Ostrea edulis]